MVKALVEEQCCYEVVKRAVVLAGRSLANKRCHWETAEYLDAKMTADNKEAANHTRNLTTADMAATVFVIDTQRQETADAVQLFWTDAPPRHDG
jgi:hypothetical protein